MGILERLAGAVISLLTILLLLVAGVILFIPDAGRYLRIKRL